METPNQTSNGVKKLMIMLSKFKKYHLILLGSILVICVVPIILVFVIVKIVDKSKFEYRAVSEMFPENIDIYYNTISMRLDAGIDFLEEADGKVNLILDIPKNEFDSVINQFKIFNKNLFQNINFIHISDAYFEGENYKYNKITGVVILIRITPLSKKHNVDEILTKFYGEKVHYRHEYEKIDSNWKVYSRQLEFEPVGYMSGKGTCGVRD